MSETWDDIKKSAYPSMALVRTSRRQRYFRPTDAKEDVYARETIELNKQDLIDATGGGTGFNDQHLIEGIDDVEEKVDALEPRVKKNEDDIADLKLNLGDYDYLLTRINYLDTVASSAYNLAKSNENRLNQLESDKDETELDLSALHLKDSQQDAKIKQNEIDIAALKGIITGGEDVSAALAQIEKNKQDIKKINDSLLITNGKVSDNQRNIDKNTSEINSLKKDVRDLQGKEDLTPRVEDLEDTVGQHEVKIKNLSSDVRDIDYLTKATAATAEKNKTDITSLNSRMGAAEYDIVDLQGQVNSLTPYDDTGLWDDQKEQNEKIANNTKDIENNKKSIQGNASDIKDLQDAEIFETDVLLVSSDSRKFATQAELNAHIVDNKADKEEINKVNDRIDLLGQDVKTNTDNIENLGEILDALISGGIEGEVEIDLANYYKKSETYNSQEIDLKLDKKVNRGGDTLKGLYTFSGEEGEGGISIVGAGGDVTLSIREDGVISQNFDGANSSARNFITRGNLVAALDELHENLDVDNLLVNESIKIADTSSAGTPLDIAGVLKVDADGTVTQDENLPNDLGRNLMNRKNVTDITKEKYDKAGGKISGAVTIESTESQPLKISGNEGVNVTVYNSGTIAQNPVLENANNNHMVNRKNLNDGLAAKANKSGDTFTGPVAIDVPSNQTLMIKKSGATTLQIWADGSIDQENATSNTKPTNLINRKNLTDALANYSEGSHNHNNDYAAKDHNHESDYARLDYPNEFVRAQQINTKTEDNYGHVLLLRNEGSSVYEMRKDGQVIVGPEVSDPRDNALITRKFADNTYTKPGHYHSDYLPKYNAQAHNMGFVGTMDHVGFKVKMENATYVAQASQEQNDKLGKEITNPAALVTYGKYADEVGGLRTDVDNKSEEGHVHDFQNDVTAVLIGQNPTKVGQLGYKNNTLLLKVK